MSSKHHGTSAGAATSALTPTPAVTTDVTSQVAEPVARASSAAPVGRMGADDSLRVVDCPASESGRGLIGALVAESAR
jgi:hypothetical protein